MSGETFYINTDLDLIADQDLDAVAAFLDKKGWSVHHAERHPDGYWLGVFEVPGGEEEGPEQAICAMLDVIENLPVELQELWNACSKREFNVGFQAGEEPRAFEQALSGELLKRISTVGASVGITIYALDKLESWDGQTN